jgi:cytidyltransferase-like protein
MTYLTQAQKANLAKWHYAVEDHSISTKVLTPFWNEVVTWMPKYVAPNTISFVGALAVRYAQYLTESYEHSFMMIMTCVFLLFAYQTLDAIDGKQARRTKNGTPMGELFDHFCDSQCTIMITLMLCSMFKVPIESRAALGQTAIMLFLFEHLKAFQTRKVKIGLFGPGELLWIVQGLLVYHAFYPINLSWFSLKHSMVLLNMSTLLVGLYSLLNLREKHYGTSNGLLIILVIRTFFIDMSAWKGVPWLFSDFDDNYLAMVATDLIVAKMANRELHPTCVIIGFVTMFNSPTLTYGMVIEYYCTVCYEICSYLNISMFNTSCNVYVCGVFDLCHAGHKIMFENALKNGSRLVVGVHSDADVESYKRTPLMNMDERARAVSLCRNVAEVVGSAPLTITKKFIEKHSIHVVCCSEEYDNENDQYYKVAREMGILKVLPRTSNISTSELLDRIQNSSEKKN